MQKSMCPGEEPPDTCAACTALRGAETSGSTSKEQRSSRRAVTVFPLLILAGAAVALLFPQAFAGWGAGVTPALMIIMFGMGLTLSLPDFALVLKRPLPVIAGVILQFTIMPLHCDGSMRCCTVMS